MSQLPRVRWVALMAAIALLVTAFDMGWDIPGLLTSLAVKATGISALFMAGAKMAGELVNEVDADDPMVHTMSRGDLDGGFWGRVL